MPSKREFLAAARGKNIFSTWYAGESQSHFFFSSEREMIICAKQRENRNARCFRDTRQITKFLSFVRYSDAVAPAKVIFPKKDLLRNKPIKISPNGYTNSFARLEHKAFKIYEFDLRRCTGSIVSYFKYGSPKMCDTTQTHFRWSGIKFSCDLYGLCYVRTLSRWRAIKLPDMPFHVILIAFGQ